MAHSLSIKMASEEIVYCETKNLRLLAMPVVLHLSESVSSRWFASLFSDYFLYQELYLFETDCYTLVKTM